MQTPTTSEPETTKTLPTYIKGFILIAKLLGYFLVVLILCGLLGEGMAALAPNLNREDMLTGRLTDWRSMTLLYFGMTIGAIIGTYFFRTVVDRLSFQTVGLAWEQIGTKLLKGMLWAIGIQLIVFIIMLTMGAISPSMNTFDPLDLFGFFVLFLLVSINEEIIFRGYVTSLLAKHLHFIPTLIISSLIFAGVHIGNADFTWMGFASIFFGGYLLGILYLKYQDLYLPIGMHWLWNYFQGNILGFDVSGMDVPALIQLEMHGADWLTGGEFGLEGSLLAVLLLIGLATYLTYEWYNTLTPMDLPPTA